MRCWLTDEHGVLSYFYNAKRLKCVCEHTTMFVDTESCEKNMAIFHE